jgi:hypothetical protein
VQEEGIDAGPNCWAVCADIKDAGEHNVLLRLR